MALSPAEQKISDRLYWLFRPEDVPRILKMLTWHGDGKVVLSVDEDATVDEFVDQLARELIESIRPYLKPGARP